MNTIHIQASDSMTDLTAAFKAHRVNTRFILDAGVYYVDNANAFDDEDYGVVGIDCEIIGAGSAKTTIHVLDLSIPADAQQVEGLTVGSRSRGCSSARLEGFTVSMPVEDILKKRPSIGTVGLHIWSNSSLIRDIVVVGVVGSPPAASGASREGFGVLVNQSGKPCLSPGPHHRISDVQVLVFDRPDGRDNYINGFYCGLTDPNVYAVCDNIVVVSTGKAPSAVAFGVNSRVIGTRWRSVGPWVRGVYCDVKGGSDVLITDSMLEVTSTALELQTGQGEVWDNIALTNSCVRFRPEANTGYCAALVLTDNAYKTNPGKFTGVQLRDCRLIGHSYKSIPFYAGGVNTPAATECGLIRCKRSGVRWPGANLVPGATFLDE